MTCHGICQNDRHIGILHLVLILTTSPRAERSFSSLRLMKTYLRSTMKEDRLNGLALMTIHNDIHFSYDNVIDQYVMQQNRHLQFE